MVYRFRLTRSPLFRWAGPSAAGQAHLSRGLGAAAGGDARTHGVNGMAAGRRRRLCGGRRCTLR